MLEVRWFRCRAQPAIEAVGHQEIGAIERVRAPYANLGSAHERRAQPRWQSVEVASNGDSVFGEQELAADPETELEKTRQEATGSEA
jgi:hypothetical protein